jgi:fibronectin-binding autotransporter adhesin
MSRPKTTAQSNAGSNIPVVVPAWMRRVCVIARWHCVVGALVFAFSPQAVLAQTLRTWNGGGSDNNWNTAANWTTGTAPVATNSLVFSGATRVTSTNNLTANTTFDSLTLTQAGFTLAGNALQLSSSGTDISSSGAGTNQIRFATSASTGDLTISVGSGNNLSFQNGGNIGGSGGLMKIGTGTLTLSGSNSYSGVTTISAGVLSLNSATALAGGGNVTFAGGTMQYTTSGLGIDVSGRIVSSTAAINVFFDSGVTGTTTWANSIASSNTNGLTKSGAGGTLILSASNGFSGNVLMSATNTGAQSTFLVVNHASALGSGTSVTVNKGALVIGSGITTGSGKTLSVGSAGGASLTGGLTVFSGTGTWAGAVTLSGAPRIGYENDSSLVIAGAVGGSAGFTVSGQGNDTNISDGNGSVLLQSVSTYTGITSIVRGRLRIGVADTLPTTTTLDVLNSAVASANKAATFDLNGFNQTVAGLTSTGNNGATSGTAGYANGYVTNSAGGAVKTFTVNQATSGTYAGLVTGNLAFTKTGAGNLTLVPVFVTTNGANTFVSGTNTFTGDTRVNGGTLTLSTAVGSTSLALAGSTFDSDGAGTLSFGTMTAVTFGGLKGAGGLALQNGSSAAVALTVGANNASTTYAGALSGAGSLVKVGSGTTTLGGVNTYAGTTAVNVGTLLVNGQLGGGAVSVTPEATLGGSGVIGGAVTVDGLLSPGNSPGDLSVASLVLNASSTVLMEIDGPTAGTQYDQVSILSAGSIAYDGALQLNLSQAFSDNTTFNLFEGFGTSFSGNFATVTSVGSAYNGLTFTRVNNLWTSTSTGGGQSMEFNQATGQLVIVPEPGAIALAGVGVAAAAWVSRIRAAGRRRATS